MTTPFEPSRAQSSPASASRILVIEGAGSIVFRATRVGVDTALAEFWPGAHAGFCHSLGYDCADYRLSLRFGFGDTHVGNGR